MTTANLKEQPDSVDRSGRTHCYLVRLIIECDTDAEDYMWLEVRLPFVPFVGLQVRLKAIDEAGWFDEPYIDAVEFIVPLDKFECQSHFCAKVTPDIVKLLRDRGWQEL